MSESREVHSIRADEWNSINEAWLNGECRVFVWPPSDHAKRPILRCEHANSGNDEHFLRVVTMWPMIDKLCPEVFAAWDTFRVFWRGIDGN